MEDLTIIIIYSFFSGITVFFGGLLSSFFEKYFQKGLIKEIILHSSISFGAGIMIAAVAFVLVPKGIEELDILPILFMFL